MAEQSDELSILRSGKGRRMTDPECKVHEDRLDAVDKNLAAQGGWLKVGSSLLTIAVFVVGILCTYIISQLGSIMGMLGKNDVVMERHTGQIQTLQEDVKEIKDRNRYVDQQSGLLNAEIRKAKTPLTQ
jgi:hypothetical protein